MSNESSATPVPEKDKLWARATMGFLSLLENDHSRRNVGTVAAVSVMALGTALLTFAFGRFVFADRGIGIVGPGVTLIVAGGSALIAQLGLSSWAEQRKRDRETALDKQRETIYQRVAQLLVSSFVGTNDMRADADLRSLVSLYGSARVLEAMGDWQGFITYLHSTKEKIGGGFELEPDESIAVQNLLSRVLHELRRDLGISDPDVTPIMLLEAVFNVPRNN
ncbi:hypothetical protein [Glutamicibacter arilaitensis]|uniref:hypothetical protein n=1 Tax=Glutamicibacter arilaitensis TaxID=256701 RepID=UPI00385031D2